MTDRRYSEAEMAAIFAEATRIEPAGRRQLARRDGMTLAELQAIGTEAGIPADLVERAAHNLDRGAPSAVTRMMGLPVGVGYVAEIDRRVTDAEWDRLVADLRQTFDARGMVRVDGSLRHWTNGNLQAYLEPTEVGERLRLRTLNGNARSQVFGGLATLAATVAVVASLALAGRLGDSSALTGVGFLASVGVGLLGLGVVRLPGWARTRQQQMAGIAERFRSLTP
jgi:hypothetical protein